MSKAEVILYTIWLLVVASFAMYWGITMDGRKSKFFMFVAGWLFACTVILFVRRWREAT